MNNLLLQTKRNTLLETDGRENVSLVTTQKIYRFKIRKKKNLFQNFLISFIKKIKCENVQILNLPYLF